MKRLLKKTLVVMAAVLMVVLVGVGIYAGVQASRFDESMAKRYDVPPLNIQRSTDPSVLARGKHLTEAIGGCTAKDCHGRDLAGGTSLEMGPLGTITGPNITPAGTSAAYSDGELGRLIRHGIRKDGHSLRFMPAQDFAWLPDADVTALVSYVRTVPPVQRPNGPLELGILAKVLDRRDQIVIDVARRIDHETPNKQPVASESVEYGGLLARSCTGCHGDHLSGGPIPGAPSEFAVPANLTPHETGLKGWTYEDFDRVLTKGIRKDGKKLDPFMPYESFSKLDTTEKRAMWAYLSTLPPRPFGQR